MTIMKDWLLTFGKIITKPLPQTFVDEAQKSKGKFTSAVFWLLFIVVFSHVIGYIGNKSVESLYYIILWIVFLPIVFLFYVFCVHLLYMRLFHRTKNHYDELLYIMVSIFVIVGVLNTFLVLIPSIGDILSWGVYVYGFVLILIAVKAITQLKLWETIVTVALSTIIVLGGVFCIPALIFSLINTVPRVF